MVRFYLLFYLTHTPPPPSHVHTEEREAGIENKFKLFQYEFEARHNQ